MVVDYQMRLRKSTSIRENFPSRRGILQIQFGQQFGAFHAGEHDGVVAVIQGKEFSLHEMAGVGGDVQDFNEVFHARDYRDFFSNVNTLLRFVLPRPRQRLRGQLPEPSVLRLLGVQTLHSATGEPIEPHLAFALVVIAAGAEQPTHAALGLHFCFVYVHRFDDIGFCSKVNCLFPFLEKIV
jgi:hypothetical protein